MRVHFVCTARVFETNLLKHYDTDIIPTDIIIILYYITHIRLLYARAIFLNSRCRVYHIPVQVTNTVLIYGRIISYVR